MLPGQYRPRSSRATQQDWLGSAAGGADKGTRHGLELEGQPHCGTNTHVLAYILWHEHACARLYTRLCTGEWRAQRPMRPAKDCSHAGHRVLEGHRFRTSLLPRPPHTCPNPTFVTPTALKIILSYVEQRWSASFRCMALIGSAAASGAPSSQCGSSARWMIVHYVHSTSSPIQSSCKVLSKQQGTRLSTIWRNNDCVCPLRQLTRALSKSCKGQTGPNWSVCTQGTGRENLQLHSRVAPSKWTCKVSDPTVREYQLHPSVWTCTALRQHT